MVTFRPSAVCPPQAKSCSSELEALQRSISEPSGDAAETAAAGGAGDDGHGGDEGAEAAAAAAVGQRGRSRQREVARRVEACARLHFAFALHALGSESYEGGRVCC